MMSATPLQIAVASSKEAIYDRMDSDRQELDSNPNAVYACVQDKHLALTKEEGGSGSQDARLEYAEALVKLRLRPMKGEDTAGCEQAVEELKVLIDQQLRLMECMILLTEAFYHLGEYTQAEACVAAALKWQPRDDVALAWREIVKGKLLKGEMRLASCKIHLQCVHIIVCLQRRQAHQWDPWTSSCAL